MRMVSFLSLNQALSMQTDIAVWHRLIQKAQRSTAQLCFSTLCDALEYFPIKIYNNFQLKFSSFWFPAQTSLLAKPKTWVGESQPAEQTTSLELYKDMAGWGWCRWRQVHTWDERGSRYPLTNFQLLCLEQRSEMFAHTQFYQRRNQVKPPS